MKSMFHYSQGPSIEVYKTNFFGRWESDSMHNFYIVIFTRKMSLNYLCLNSDNLIYAINKNLMQ